MLHSMNGHCVMIGVEPTLNHESQAARGLWDEKTVHAATLGKAC